MQCYGIIILIVPLTFLSYGTRIIPDKIVYALSHIRQDSQVFNFYTDGCDDELFVDYGFCCEPGKLVTLAKFNFLKGVNDKTTIFFTLNEVVTAITSKLHIDNDPLEVASEFELRQNILGQPGFTLYSNGLDLDLQGTIG